MTHIKAYCITLLALCALVFSARAQSSPMFPYEGATHTYVVNGLTPGLEYTFFMTADAHENSVLDDGSVYEFDFLDATSGVLEPGQTMAKLPVLWNYGASEHVYYLWIKLQNPDGCSPIYRYVQILPQNNQFDLLSENIPFDNTESCPAIDPALGFNPLATEYNMGTTHLQFKVRREGGNRGWMFEPVVSIDPDWNLEVEIVSIEAQHAGTLTADAANLYFVPATDNEVLVNVAVKNYAGTEQLVTLEIRNQKEEQTLLSDSNPDNDKVEHRITVAPVISDLEEIL